uniref:Uncharacterized protein n=1 Tax=Anguilla anguilla TaxID=7936 RepID=A0A0E9RT85_ANGAN
MGTRCASIRVINTLSELSMCVSVKIPACLTT